MASWQTLRDGGLILYDPDFQPPTAADTLFAWLLAEIPWHQEKMYGKPVPRLNAWYSDAGLRYRYSGLTHTGTGWRPELSDIKTAVETAAGMPFNSLLLNRYRDGRDSMGYHADDEPELGENPAVATVSLGAVRRFRLRHPKSKETLTYTLAHGSLLVMAGTSQHHWLHMVPKTAQEVGERISLTFRFIHEVPPTRTP